MARGSPDPKKRRKFVRAVASGMGVTASAQLSGYARVYAHRLLKRPDVQAEIEKARDELPPLFDDEDERPDPVPEAQLAAIRVLGEILDREVGLARDADRIAAAKVILALKPRKRAKAVAAPSAVADQPEPDRLTAAEVAVALRFRG